MRRDDLLLVMVNTSFSDLGGFSHVECAWLDATLTAQTDARHPNLLNHHIKIGVTHDKEQARMR